MNVATTAMPGEDKKAPEDSGDGVCDGCAGIGEGEGGNGSGGNGGGGH